MKKILSLLLAGILLFAASSCSKPSPYSDIIRLEKKIDNPLTLPADKFIEEVNNLIVNDDDNISDIVLSSDARTGDGKFKGDYYILVSTTENSGQIQILSPADKKLNKDIINDINNASVKKAIIEILFNEKTDEEKEELLNKMKIQESKKKDWTETIGEYTISTTVKDDSYFLQIKFTRK